MALTEIPHERWHADQYRAFIDRAGYTKFSQGDFLYDHLRDICIKPERHIWIDYDKADKPKSMTYQQELQAEINAWLK